MKYIISCLLFVLVSVFVCTYCEAEGGPGCRPMPTGEEISCNIEGPGMPAAQLVSHYETAQNEVTIRNNIVQSGVITGGVIAFTPSSGNSLNSPLDTNVVISGDNIVLSGDIIIDGNLWLIGPGMSIDDFLSGFSEDLLAKYQSGDSGASIIGSIGGTFSVDSGTCVTLQDVQTLSMSTGTSMAVSGEMTAVTQEETKVSDAEAEAMARDALRRQQMVRERMLKDLLGEDGEE